MRVQRDDFFEKDRFGAGDVFDGLARHGIGQEADEITGMPRFERDADLAVGLEAADARAMPGARIDDDKRPPRSDRFRRPAGGMIRTSAIVDRPIRACGRR